MKRLGFIGCGNMGSAMVRGILDQGFLKREEIIVSQKSEDGARRTREAFGVETAPDNATVAREAQIVVLAVKPVFYPEVLKEISPAAGEKNLLVGLAPGKSLEYIKRESGGRARVARMMPNTPAMVGKGMTAVCTEAGLCQEDKDFLLAMAGCFGGAELVEERLMDAAGAVGGCSPAYVYMLIEAMADAGVHEGMPRQMAYRFAAQTVLGSAAMVLETGKHPGELKDQVTSPGGTTIEGVRILEEKGFRGSVMDALIAASEKGKGL